MFRENMSDAAVFGIGADIVDIDRIRKVFERRGARFLQRIFTFREINACEARRERLSCYAARYAAKEAVYKALGGNLAGIRWHDLEISRDDRGTPRVTLSGAAAELAARKGVKAVHISLSHERHYALAFAIATGREG